MKVMTAIYDNKEVYVRYVNPVLGIALVSDSSDLKKAYKVSTDDIRQYRKEV